jgi:CRISPR/Cas system-associated exonuclease Cas4 (RecB family)
MRNLSKSKLLAYRQCPKRIWLEVHHPELREDSAAAHASFQVGYQVGDIARQIYDPSGLGTLIDVETEGFDGAFARSQCLINTATQPIFEAGFCAAGALAFADVMLPVPTDDGLNGKPAWRMVEVKSSTSIKDYHYDDAAVQAYVAAGVPLSSVALAHIDSSWVYPGGGDYRGLLVEHDLSEEVFARTDEVKAWIEQATAVLEDTEQPSVETGAHCKQPFECGFYEHCNQNAVQAAQPIHWLPNLSKKKAATLAELGITELPDVPDELLSQRQLRVKTHTLNASVFFDATGAAADLAEVSAPGQAAYFLDFESIQFAVPIWAGTRPYQQNCYQFSLHTLLPSGQLTHEEFLDLSGADPALDFAQALVAGCGQHGAVFVYNAAFEATRIRELAERFPAMADDLLAIKERIVDLLPVARAHYYHPSQEGSWSIKTVLPALVPELGYDALDGVQNAGMATEAYLEAIHPDTTPEHKAQLTAQLLAYCQLDTYAMVRLWQVFADRSDLKL